MTTIDFVNMILFMVAIMTGFSIWACIGLLILFILDAQTNSYLETVICSILFPVILLSSLLEWTGERLENNKNAEGLRAVREEGRKSPHN